MATLFFENVQIWPFSSLKSFEKAKQITKFSKLIYMPEIMYKY